MPAASPSMHYNYFHDNEIGILAYFTSSPPDSLITYNKICNNEYNFKSRYSPDINIPYNCWCTTDQSELDDGIYDIFDDGSLGIIDIYPLDTNCSLFLLSSLADNVSSEYISEDIKVYPNPTDGNINIMTESNILKVDVWSGTGAFILTTLNNNVDLSNYSAGLYFISISTNNGIVRKKIILN